MDLEKAGWMMGVLVASHFFVATSVDADMTGWMNIDCGNDEFRVGNNLIPWFTDSEYTETGTNKRVTQNQPLEEMNTLRFFPDNTQQNCYIVPVYLQTLRYIVRAGFYYGNYDSLSKPPTFDLYIDSEKWATVDTASNGGGPVFHEAIYTTHGSGFLKLCLVQTQQGEGAVPFISSIEIVPLWGSLYPMMESNATFHLITRTNLGGDEIRFTGFLSDEKYNRIWTRGETPSNCFNVKTSSNFDQLENDPPSSLLSDSIQPNVSSAPIILIVNLPQLNLQQQPAYFVFYFSEYESQHDPIDTRIMQININSQYEQTLIAPDPNQCKVVTIYPVMVMGPTINITLTRNNISTLPPMIAGMEVFTKTDSKQPHSSNGIRSHFCFACFFVQVLSLVLLMLY